jgi:hypothetical protein
MTAKKARGRYAVSASAEARHQARLWRQRAAEARRMNEPTNAEVFERLAAQYEAKASGESEVKP